VILGRPVSELEIRKTSFVCKVKMEHSVLVVNIKYFVVEHSVPTLTRCYISI
jgi:hypothetical protein